MPVTQSISHSPFANSECRTVVAPWLERALVVLGDIRKDVRTSSFGGLQCDELERQLRAVALTQKGGWQPIETAPKDGTWVHLWRTPWQEIGRMAPLVCARWSAEDESFVWPDGHYDVFTEYGRALAEEDINNGSYFDSSEFTHWRALPLPPSPAAEAAAERAQERGPQ